MRRVDWTAFLNVMFLHWLGRRRADKPNENIHMEARRKECRDLAHWMESIDQEVSREVAKSECDRLFASAMERVDLAAQIAVGACPES